MKFFLDRTKGDKVIWMVVILLSLISLLAVYSSTGTLAYAKGTKITYYVIKHIAVMLGGLVLMYVSHLIDYRYYSRIAQLLLYLSIPLLFYTLFFGTDINYAKRWLTVPVINLTFQTSDLAKLALIMFTARSLSRKQHAMGNFYEGFLPILLPILIVTVLIAPEDFSTALVTFATCVLLIFIGRMHIKFIAGLLGSSTVAIAFFVMMLFMLPEESMKGRMLTWKGRIESFVAQDAEDPYQVQQAKIAIAKGGIFRIAPGNSTQRNYLPHPYSDFIYAIIIEEYGLMGGAVIIILYLIFLYRCVRIVIKAPKAFGALLAVGLGFSLVIQAMINMGVAVNLLPVTGMTLPLVSMGGSSLLFTSFAIGIILSVSKHIEDIDVIEKEAVLLTK
ncbi:MAG: FtsW/RodA/SpoVE family cell cycle protein [Chitinophagales bacterium]|nr:FtsW/RodA/SpoVE family cell cycle protein [Chitinophagales bacterium]